MSTPDDTAMPAEYLDIVQENGEPYVEIQQGSDRQLISSLLDTGEWDLLATQTVSITVYTVGKKAPPSS